VRSSNEPCRFVIPPSFAPNALSSAHLSPPAYSPGSVLVTATIVLFALRIVVPVSLADQILPPVQLKATLVSQNSWRQRGAIASAQREQPYRLQDYLCQIYTCPILRSCSKSFLKLLSDDEALVRFNSPTDSLTRLSNQLYHPFLAYSSQFIMFFCLFTSEASHHMAGQSVCC
jgi:hypothetical protein